MSTALALPFDTQAPLTPFVEDVAELARYARAESTLRAYKSHWKDFTAWCDRNGRNSLPADPDTVVAYISACAKGGRLKAGSIQCRVSSIGNAHEVDGYPSPTINAKVRFIVGAMRRKLGTVQVGKDAIVTAELSALLAHVPSTLLGVRDRAILLVGFAGAFRRSELVALNVEDVEFGEKGVKVSIRRSKTDQEGAGQVIGIAQGTFICPVKALREWIEASGITTGPIFRRIDRHSRILKRMRPGAVAIVVKRYAQAAGLDPAKYAGHSLRAGLATSAALNGVSEMAIMKTTRHKSSVMVQRYIRDADLFRDNASGRVGL